MVAKNAPASSLDIAIARRALGLSRKISGGALNVGFALLEHFNRKTGQCDPSVARLATMLGISEPTVKRATAELCSNENQLFKKSSHGGMSHRASYRPNWERMRAIVTDWEDRMSTGIGPESDHEADRKASKMIPSTDQDRSLDGIKNDPRTPLNKPIGINPISDGASGKAEKPFDDGLDNQRNVERLDREIRLRRSERGDVEHRPSEVVSSGRTLIAEEAAIARWNRSMLKRGSAFYSRFAEWIDEARQRKATDAEMERRGGGERYLVEEMMRDGVSAYE